MCFTALFQASYTSVCNNFSASYLKKLQCIKRKGFLFQKINIIDGKDSRSLFLSNENL